MKKILLVLSIALIFVMTGCSSKSSSGDVIKIGLDDTYPPMEFRDDAQKLVGFDVDLANAIGEKIGKKVEFVPTAWDGIFTGLTAGNYDMIMSSISITAERQEVYTLSEPYLANGQVIVVLKGSDDITEPAGLAGKVVGVQLETTSHESAKKYQEQFDFELKAYDQIIQTFLDLKAGRIDAIVVDGMVAAEYMKSDAESYKISSAKLSNEPIGICFKKDANADLVKQINDAIASLREEGKLAEISNTWLGADYTSDIDSTLW